MLCKYGLCGPGVQAPGGKLAKASRAGVFQYGLISKKMVEPDGIEPTTS